MRVTAGDREVAEQIETWLAELYSPNRTAAGEIAKSARGNRPTYSLADHIDFCCHYLGRMISPDNLLDVRCESGYGGNVRLCRVALDRKAAGLDVRHEVKRDRFRVNARHVIRYFERFGSAPNRSGDELFDQVELMAFKAGAVDVAILEEAETLTEWNRTVIK
jgi:hypothetical protein